MKVKRLLLTTTLIMIMSISTFPNMVNAESSEPTITISDQIQGQIPQVMIDELLLENLDADDISIIDYVILPYQELFQSSISIKPQTSIDKVTVETKKTILDGNEVAKDEFKFSVAKGEVVTITYDITGSLKGSASKVPFSKAEIGFDLTVTGRYTKGTVYSGPDESSAYNSREFRMKFYQERGEFTQTETTTYLINKKPTVRTVSGTYTKPLSFLSYSVNKKV